MPIWIIMQNIQLLYQRNLLLLSWSLSTCTKLLAMLSQLQQKYWTIRQLVTVCVICRKYHAPLCDQKMVDLPEDRLNPGLPPFFDSFLWSLWYVHLKHVRPVLVMRTDASSQHGSKHGLLSEQFKLTYEGKQYMVSVISLVLEQQHFTGWLSHAEYIFWKLFYNLSFNIHFVIGTFFCMSAFLNVWFLLWRWLLF